MDITREMWIGAGALAFIGTVVLMLPPTTPIAPPSTSGRPHARAATSPSAELPAFPDYASTAATSPMPVVNPPPDSTTTIADTRIADSRADLASSEPDSGPSRQWRDPAPAYGDDEAGAPDPDFTMGYRWAEANGVFERRDCRRWRGSPAEDGCRAYLRDADAERGDGGVS